MTMGAKHGNLSINSENIFPIIKKWLYSDHDIFPIMIFLFVRWYPMDAMRLQN